MIEDKCNGKKYFLNQGKEDRVWERSGILNKVVGESLAKKVAFE